MRPNKITKETAKQIAIDLINDLKLWGNEYSDDDIDNLANNIDHYGNQDGYELAKSMDDDYNWSVDSNVVESLDSVSNMVYNELKKEVAKWVIDNNIQPQYKIGARVKFKSRELKEGTITNIDKDQALYYIHTDDQPITSSYIVKYENVLEL